MNILCCLLRVIAQAINIQSFRCKAPSSAATEKATETGISITFYANIRLSRLPGPWPGVEAVTGPTTATSTGSGKRFG